MIKIDGEEYTVNEEFKQDTIQIADTLDIDELNAAELFLQAQRDAEKLDRSSLASTVIIFHRQRELLLACLRMSLEKAVDFDRDEDITGPFRQLVSLILQTKDGQTGSGSSYWRKCLTSMGDIEMRLHQVAERVQSATMVGQTQSFEFSEIMDFQQQSLTRQHESLGAMAYYLIKANHTNIEDFRFLLTKLKEYDRYDVVLFHYIPALSKSISQVGRSEGSCSLREARTLHQMIVAARENDAWPLRSFQAATIAFWLAEYSGRYLELPIGSPLQGADLEVEADFRSALFMDALRDGAFHFMLSISQDQGSNDWSDPARQGFTSFLLQDEPTLSTDSTRTEPYFRQLVMEQLQAFAEAFISNMPDTLRKLRFDEDEQRRHTQNQAQLRPAEYELHLERFLILISYAYEGFSGAAEPFWIEPDGNLFGFLQWASQRQSTPRVAAFCEMLRALSEGEDCANAAHKFLLAESSTRLRRYSPLSWHHIFGELEFYSSTIKEKPALQSGVRFQPGTAQTDQLVEPESAMMLECYLRLLAHICRESFTARTWIISHPSFQLHEHLFLLCGSAIDSRLRACAFTTLTAMLTNKERNFGGDMWTFLDAWISGGSFVGLSASRSSNIQGLAAPAEQVVFDSITTGFEEPNSFVNLLWALVSPCRDDTELNDSLPFPESLGAAYRMPGIEPYVDFVFGRVFAIKSFHLQDPVQLRIIRWNCLSFAATCLSTFNEDLVLIANRSTFSIDSAIRTSSLAVYARIHPFARVMEWMFNDKVLTAFFAVFNQSIAEVNNAEPNSPLILGLLRSVEVISLVLTLQATYFDIVRPIVKLQSNNRRHIVANSALASFEDAILNNLNCVPNLGLYCGSGHQDLAVASLKLLQKLSLSPKLVGLTMATGGRQGEKGKLLIALEKDNVAETISRSMVSQMQFDEREVEQGPNAPGFVIRAAILRCLNSCLDTAPNHPTIAHLLLGFTCSRSGLSITESGSFAAGTSLFHAVVNFVVACPYGDTNTVVSWLISVNDDALQILQKLWRSSLSANLVLPELRSSDFLFLQSLRQHAVNSTTRWDSRHIQDQEFFATDSAVAYARFLHQRSAFLEHAAIELRSAIQNGWLTLSSRVQSTIFGTVSFADGQQLESLTIFDLFDFLELDINEANSLPETQFFNPVDFDICKNSGTESSYDIRSVEQLLLLRQSDLRKNGQLVTSADEQQMELDARTVLLCFIVNDRRMQVQTAHTQTLKSWVQLVIVMLESSDLESALRHAFVLRTVQMTLPKLEKSFSDNMSSALVLAQLGNTLLRDVDLASSLLQNCSGDSVSDRLLQLFRAGLVGIQNAEAPAALRDTCCQICYGYLRRVIGGSNNVLSRRHALQSVKSMGERLIEILCNDSYAGQGTCRTASLLFLDAIVTTSNEQGWKGIIEAFSRLNFIQVVVDTIKRISTDLQESNIPGKRPAANP